MSGEGRIRDATEHDGPAIVDLWTEVYFTEGKGGRATPYAEADFTGTARDGQVLVAERGGAVVGVVALFAPGTPGRAVAQTGEAELARLVVAASARRLGTGRALAGRCEEMARVLVGMRSPFGAAATRWRHIASTNPSATGACPNATRWTRPASSASSSGWRSETSGWLGARTLREWPPWRT